MASLPVLSVVKSTYGQVGDLWSKLATPVLLIFFVNLYGVDGLIALGMPEGWAQTIGWMVSTSVYVSLSVGVQRLVLLHEARSGVALFRWDLNFLRYLLTLLLYFGSWFLPMAAAQALLGITRAPGLHAALQICLIILGLLLSLTSAILIVRVSLSLPASAIGAPHPFSRSWYATRGNWFRLCAVWFLTSLPFLVVAYFVGMQQLKMIMAAPSGGESLFVDRFIFPTLWTALGAIYLPVSTVMGSLCYDILVRGDAGGGASSGAPT